MFKEDEKFDLKIRSILEEGREEVPGEVWDAVCRGLDKAEGIGTVPHKRPVPLWLRYAVTGLAAAAAVISAVIFSWNRTPSAEVPDTIAVADMPQQDSAGMASIMTAQVQDHEIRQGIGAQASKVPDAVASPEKLYAMAENAEDTPEPVIQTQETEPEETTQETGPQKKADQQDTGKKGTVQDKDISSGQAPESEDTWQDPFEGPDEDDIYNTSGKVKTSLMFFGNAISNSNAERRDAESMMSSGSFSSTGISERSEGNERYGIPVSAGVGVRLGFTPKWSMSIGLNYTYLSRTFDGIFVNAETAPIQRTEYNDIRNVQHYIGIPVNFYYTIIRKDFIDFYVYAGGAAEYCLANKYSSEAPVTPGAGPLYYNGENGSMQFSANAGIGVEFILAENIGLYIDPSLRYYFRNSNAPKSIRTVQPLMLGFEAGLRFRL